MAHDHSTTDTGNPADRRYRRRPHAALCSSHRAPYRTCGAIRLASAQHSSPAARWRESRFAALAEENWRAQAASSENAAADRRPQACLIHRIERHPTRDRIPRSGLARRRGSNGRPHAGIDHDHVASQKYGLHRLVVRSPLAAVSRGPVLPLVARCAMVPNGLAHLAIATAAPSRWPASAPSTGDLSALRPLGTSTRWMSVAVAGGVLVIGPVARGRHGHGALRAIAELIEARASTSGPLALTRTACSAASPESGKWCR